MQVCKCWPHRACIGIKPACLPHRPSKYFNTETGNKTTLRAWFITRSESMLKQAARRKRSDISDAMRAETQAVQQSAFPVAVGARVLPIRTESRSPPAFRSNQVT